MTDLQKRLEELLPCVSCGVNADPADGFGSCTCGREEQRKRIHQWALDIIGEDEEVPRPQDEESRARFYRKSGQNFLRNQQRKRLKGDIDEPRT